MVWKTNIVVATLTLRAEEKELRSRVKRLIWVANELHPPIHLYPESHTLNQKTLSCNPRRLNNQVELAPIAELQLAKVWLGSAIENF